MNNLKSLWIICCFVAGVCQAQKQETFTNPLLPQGADPWSIYHNGYYYYMHTTGRSLVLWKATSIARLAEASQKTIWLPPPSGPFSKNIWAPEIHRISNKWYIYFAADDGKNENHRMWVLENAAADPMQGEWVMKGKVGDATDQWAIDGTVFEHRGAWYMLWSGWERKDPRREVQDIFIARMANPWTVAGERVKLSTPSLPWERNWNNTTAGKPARPVYVNEGPQVLKKGTRLFLIFSASGCWTNDYALGMLIIEDSSDVTDAASWTKWPEPIFKQSASNKVYGTGHNSFFKSPDGTEDWILYHANAEKDQGCGGKRSPRAQKITWQDNGMPYLGEPAKEGEPLALPSGYKN
jgi:GH43 family beta-xylosidase